jgi:hypothetical protein
MFKGGHTDETNGSCVVFLIGRLVYKVWAFQPLSSTGNKIEDDCACNAVLLPASAINFSRFKTRSSAQQFQIRKQKVDEFKVRFLIWPGPARIRWERTERPYGAPHRGKGPMIARFPERVIISAARK